ncbi:MAG TPA: DUF6191 domain-containing protein [Aldersonia sp.]
MLTVLAWVTGLAAAALLIDQLALWAERHGWLYWRKRKPEVNGGATVAMFGELQSLLSPSNRHVVEEQRARQTLRVDAATDEPVDLDAGVVRLPRQPGTGTKSGPAEPSS